MSRSYSDDEVLHCLNEDPTRSAKDIASEIGTYRQKVWREKKKLEREKAIWGYTAVVDENKLNRVMYVLLGKTKPINKAFVDKLLAGSSDRQTGETYDVRLISSFFVNGEFDWVFTFSASNHQEAKRYFEYIRKVYGDFLIEKPVLMDVSFSLWREGKLNPEREKLYEFIP